MTRALLLVALAAGLVLPVASATGASGQPVARAAKGCASPKYPGSGYFTALQATAVSCDTAKSVALAHYRCRIRHGVAGRCATAVAGRYRCTEKRQTISTEIDGVVTCRRGAKKVVYGYQQNR